MFSAKRTLEQSEAEDEKSTLDSVGFVSWGQCRKGTKLMDWKLGMLEFAAKVHCWIGVLRL